MWVPNKCQGKNEWPQTSENMSLRTWRPQTDTHRADGWEGDYSYIVTSVLQDNGSVTSSKAGGYSGAQFSQGQLRLCPCLIVYTMVQDAEPNQPLELGEKAAGHWGAETREVSGVTSLDVKKLMRSPKDNVCRGERQI